MTVLCAYIYTSLSSSKYIALSHVIFALSSVILFMALPFDTDALLAKIREDGFLDEHSVVDDPEATEVCHVFREQLDALYDRAGALEHLRKFVAAVPLFEGQLARLLRPGHIRNLTAFVAMADAGDFAALRECKQLEKLEFQWIGVFIDDGEADAFVRSLDTAVSHIADVKIGCKAIRQYPELVAAVERVGAHMKVMPYEFGDIELEEPFLAHPRVACVRDIEIRCNVDRALMQRLHRALPRLRRLSVNDSTFSSVALAEFVGGFHDLDRVSITNVNAAAGDIAAIESKVNVVLVDHSPFELFQLNLHGADSARMAVLRDHGDEAAFLAWLHSMRQQRLVIEDFIVTASFSVDGEILKTLSHMCVEFFIFVFHAEPLPSAIRAIGACKHLIQVIFQTRLSPEALHSIICQINASTSIRHAAFYELCHVSDEQLARCTANVLVNGGHRISFEERIAMARKQLWRKACVLVAFTRANAGHPLCDSGRDIIEHELAAFLPE